MENYRKLGNECNRQVKKSQKEALGKELSDNPNKLWCKYNQIVKGQDENEIKLVEKEVKFSS